MDQYIIDDLLDRINELIDIMNEHEEMFYISIEVAHQLRDEVEQSQQSVDSSDE